MTFRGRSYVLRDVLGVHCERCDADFSLNDKTGCAPLPPLVPSAENICCTSPNCAGKVLASRTPGAVRVAYGYQLIVAKALLYASCDKCGNGRHFAQEPFSTAATALVRTPLISRPARVAAKHKDNAPLREKQLNP